MVFAQGSSGLAAQAGEQAGQMSQTQLQTAQGQIDVADQALDANGMLLFDRIHSNGPGWLVIHCVTNDLNTQGNSSAQNGTCLPLSYVNAQLGLSNTGQANNNNQGSSSQNNTSGMDLQLEARSALAWVGLVNGDNKGILVQLDPKTATPMVFAELHHDTGTVGTFEFPNGDMPVRGANGRPIGVLINITGGIENQAQGNPGATAQPTVGVTATVTATATATVVPTVVPTVGATSTLTTTANMTGTATPGSTLPVTGGSSIPWSLVVMALGGLILVGGLGLAFARRS
jgi:hypothetical protein